MKFVGVVSLMVSEAAEKLIKSKQLIFYRVVYEY